MMRRALGPMAAGFVLMFVAGSAGALAAQTGTLPPGVLVRDFEPSTSGTIFGGRVCRMESQLSSSPLDLSHARPACPTDSRSVAVFQLDARPQGSPWGRAFLVEAAGGSVGSAVGLGLGFVVTNPGGCDVEDLGCTIRQVSGGILFSSVGAATGTVLAGRAASTGPSLLGAAIGAIAGIPAGLGLVHLLSEDIDLVHADAPLFITYAVTHGIVTAIGSRIGAALRN